MTSKAKWMWGILVILLVIGVTYAFSINYEFKEKSPSEKHLLPKKIIRVYFEPINRDPKPQAFDFDYSTEYWETRENVDFQLVNNSEEADVTVRWVRDYSDEWLGYTFHKSFVEIGFGDTTCNNTWYPYDSFTTERVLIHELGHVLGKDHSPDPHDIMYYQLPKTYQLSIDTQEFRGSFSSQTCQSILKKQQQIAQGDYNLRQ